MIHDWSSGITVTWKFMAIRLVLNVFEAASTSARIYENLREFTLN